MWNEWEPDPEAEMSEGPAPALWCDGWTTSKDALAVALFRFGFAPDMGAGWRLSEITELRHTYLCTEDSAGDERTLYECEPSEGNDPRAVTFAIIGEVDH
jgi:hypothetical protein